MIPALSLLEACEYRPQVFQYAILVDILLIAFVHAQTAISTKPLQYLLIGTHCSKFQVLETALMQAPCMRLDLVHRVQLHTCARTRAKRLVSP